jgi:protoporphyrinogen IX oxidase
MLHIYLKALHIIGFVSWFAGLFYLVRIFVYHAEAKQKPLELQAVFESEFIKMSARAYKIICNPAMMITWTFGIAMLVNTPSFLEQSWLQVKLVLLVILTAYHIACGLNIKRLERGEAPFTSFQYRLLNEFPTLFLISIVLLATVKDLINFLYLFVGILAFGFLLFKAAKAYRKSRES